MKTHDPALAAHRYAEAALQRTRGCPLSAAVVLWEQGLRAPYTKPSAWKRGSARARLKKALALWRERGYNKELEECFIL